MTPEVAEVLTRVSEELEHQIAMLEHHGVTYAGAYAEKTLSTAHGFTPLPVGMHPLLAKMIREATLDELAARRRGLAA